MTIEATALRTINQHNMLSRGDRVLAAVSGGADSVCMLSLLSRLRDELGFELFCAHLNHGLRGADADRDEKFVVKLCRELKIKVYTKKADVAAIAKERRLTCEEAGRYVRYEFFEELARLHKFNKIATAHNKNDNAETVLMRILRGTGIDGLGGIHYTRDDGVIRPILDISRTEIEEYCRLNNLSFCVDATNFENDFTRNKIRNRLIPYLETEFNGNVIDTLDRLSRTAGEDAEFLNQYAKRLYKRLGNPLPSKKPVTLHIDSLKMLERSVAVRVVRLAAADTVRGISLNKKHIDDVLELMNKSTGAAVDLPAGLRAENAYGWITFKGSEGVEYINDEKGFFAEVSVGETIALNSVGKRLSLRIEGGGYSCKPNELAADYDLIGEVPLFWRTRRSGDKIAWFDDGRTKKIKNVFIDAKIPKSERDKIPLLCTGDEVLAIVGMRVSRKYRKTKDTERVLVIEYGNLEKKQDID